MEDRERRAVSARAVLSGEVVEELVGGDLCEEVVSRGEAFDIEEVGFDGSVNGFDIGICVAAPRRDVGVGGFHE